MPYSRRPAPCFICGAASPSCRKSALPRKRKTSTFPKGEVVRLLRNARLRFLASLLAALAASGCVQMQPQVLLTPDTRDGRLIYSVFCGCFAYSIGSCFLLACLLCGVFC